MTMIVMHIFTILFLSAKVAYSTCVLSIPNHVLQIKLHERQNFHVRIENITNELNFTINVQHLDIIHVLPSFVHITILYKDLNVSFQVEAIGAGHSEVTIANISESHIDTSQLYVRVTVYKNAHLDNVSLLIGWIYFLAWSISFYPQMYSNYKRKSVVGLNFDFLILNTVGFTLYSVFNLGLYSISTIREEYAKRHPRGLNPVQMNDIVFSVHASVATIVTLLQCLIYERSNQRVSITARLLLGVFAGFLLISCVLSFAHVLHWLDFLYYCSYVKLTITLIKYIPQAYMNYQRKSTVGWSIENIILDFTGGMLSMLQMIINAFNYDDWISIFGDPTKFGLGLFSVLFDVFFMVQHYVLYSQATYVES